MIGRQKCLGMDLCMREAGLLHSYQSGRRLQFLQLPKPHPLCKWVDGRQPLLEVLEQDSGLMQCSVMQCSDALTSGSKQLKINMNAQGKASFALFCYPYPDKALADNRTYRTSRTGWDPKLGLEQNWLLEHARFPSGRCHLRCSALLLGIFLVRFIPFQGSPKCNRSNRFCFPEILGQNCWWWFVVSKLGVRAPAVLCCTWKRKITETRGWL